ncbi:MAG: hypothetical protein AAF468_08325 [Pseudomonadota bacterium]
MYRTALTLFTFAMLGAATNAFAGEKCKCRFNGGYVEEGQTVCMKTPTGMSLARCERVLNNTSWKILQNGCPAAKLDVEPPHTPIGKLLSARS